ncbi:MAG: PAS domain S-box protein [Planctomycetes bacterium]|nr:PAS domain S-box protein [Planctomycetota bacterium]
MGEFLRKLFDTSDFPARWHCGDWSTGLGWLHILSDLAIWIAYMGIPIALATVVLRRRDVPFPRVFWLFGAFIASCGFTHLIEAGMFYWPMYRLSGLAKLITAAISLMTMIALPSYVARAVRLPGFRSALGEIESSQRSASAARIRELEAERSRLRLAVEASGAGLWDWSIASDELTWDDRTRELFGLTGDERPRGLASFRAGLHPDDRDPVVAQLEQALPTATALTLHFRILRPDGGVRFALSRCSVLRDATGQPERMTGVVLDVSERARSEELFRRAVESAPCGMLLVDQDGAIRLANANAAKLFGWEPTELVGRSVDELVPATQRARHAELRRAFLQEGQSREMAAGRDLAGVRRDGTEVPLEILLSPVELGDARAVISTIIDITPRKLVEAERARHAEELERRNRALDEFAYLVSHDLKAPLRAISMVSQWLQEDYAGKLDARGDEQLDLLQERARTMNLLIEGALHYARAGREQGVRAPVDSAEVLREAIELANAPPGSVVQTSDLPVVTYDREHLLKILLNLLSNAVQYGGDGVRIEVSATDRGTEIEFCVADSGPGIDPRYHDHVFQIFKRLPDSPGESSGVGLAIVRMLVTRHCGRLELDSEPGHGARFRFTIPKEPA